MKNGILGGFAALLMVSVSAPAMAQSTYDTTGSYASDIAPFGESDTATYGQLFTVGGDNVLNNFSLYLDGGSGNALSFKGYVYAWDGSKATGPALYASGVQSYSSGLQEYDFSTGNLNLVSGQQYVAFLSTSGLQDGNYNTVSMPLSGGNQVGGAMVWYNNGNDFGALTSNSWDGNGQYYGDAWFKASFNGGAVPEPASWALMLGGFGLVGSAMRSSRRKAAVSFG